MDDVTRRRLVGGALTAGGVVVVGPHIYEWSHETNDRVRGAEARPFIETACEHLENNYDLLSNHSLTSPRAVATLDMAQLDANLQAAETTIEQATDRSGSRFLNDDIVETITAVETYSWVQRLLLDVLDAPITIDGGQLTDEFIEEAWQRVRHTTSSEESTALESDPYELAAVRRQLDDAIEDLRFDRLDAFLNHSTESVEAIVDEALNVIAEFRSLYLQLRLHTKLPLLQDTVLEIDQALSQTDSPGELAEENRFRVADLQYELRLDEFNPLPDALAAYPLGTQGVTGSDIERSCERFHEAIGAFETSLEALSQRQHAESNAAWTSGLTTLYQASQENPVSTV